jgi:hypothetical protein
MEVVIFLRRILRNNWGCKIFRFSHLNLNDEKIYKNYNLS